MSTKTIAVDSRVYRRLAAVKLESESFSKAIDRLVGTATAHSGRDILRSLETHEPLSNDDSARMLAVVRESREHETWVRHDMS